MPALPRGGGQESGVLLPGGCGIGPDSRILDIGNKSSPMLGRAEGADEVRARQL